MFSFLNGFMGRGAMHDVIECLASAMEARDKYTSGHSSRVADMSFSIARYMGIGGAKLDNIHLAAHLHDIGKLGIPEYIINKCEKLLPEEWEQIKKHPEIGFTILEKVKDFKTIAQIVLYHHERWDGRGYPCGLKGYDIPLGSRIIAVADSIDAMTSQRPYRSAMTWEKCMEEIHANRGLQFDPEPAEAAEKLWKQWVKQKECGISSSIKI